MKVVRGSRKSTREKRIYDKNYRKVRHGKTRCNGTYVTLDCFYTHISKRNDSGQHLLSLTKPSPLIHTRSSEKCTAEHPGDPREPSHYALCPHTLFEVDVRTRTCTLSTRSLALLRYLPTLAARHFCAGPRVFVQRGLRVFSLSFWRRCRDACVGRAGVCLGSGQHLQEARCVGVARGIHEVGEP